MLAENNLLSYQNITVGLRCIYVMCWLGIDICANTLFENTERVEALSKIVLKKLLSLATKESYFIFNGKLYK